MIIGKLLKMFNKINILKITILSLFTKIKIDIIFKKAYNLPECSVGNHFLLIAYFSLFNNIKMKGCKP